LETRLPDIYGKGEVNSGDLIRRSVLMRPDRIIVGVVQGAEVFDMLQAMSAGHKGSMTTIHAYSPRDALLRLETMIGLSAIDAQKKAIQLLISSAINVVIHVDRYSDGVCRMKSLSEITGMEGDVVSMLDIFVFKRHGVDETER
jgi:pilus assembly protein CpaF